MKRARDEEPATERAAPAEEQAAPAEYQLHPAEYQPHPSGKPQAAPSEEDPAENQAAPAEEQGDPAEDGSTEWQELSKGATSDLLYERRAGVVLLRGFLSIAEQLELAGVCLSLVEGTALCQNEVTKGMKQVTIGKQKTAQGGFSTEPLICGRGAHHDSRARL